MEPAAVINADDDRRLLQRVADHDPDALAALYERHSGLVYLRINLILHDQAASEDLVQEVFLTVWKHAAEFDPQRGPLGAWLTAVARNRARDYLRWKKLRTGPKQLDFERPVTPDTLADLEQEIMDRDRTGALRRALARLDVRHREILTLAFFQELTHSELAKHLHQPLAR